VTNGSFPAGWYQDPTGQGDARYWNGASWTEAVDQSGVRVNVSIDPAQAQLPPLPGTEVQLPIPMSGTQTSRRSPIGAIVAVLVVVLLVVVIFVIVSNNDSSDDSPTPATDVAPATEAPSAPATEGG
jgi:hypothetical protein